MLGDFPVAIRLTLASVLIVAAAAKFRRADDLASWATLGVPRVLRREWVRTLHPWGELVLGIAIALLGGWPGVLASLAAVILMAVYTVLIARVVARHIDTSCACFGDRQRVTSITTARNVWLTLLAVGSTAAAWSTPLFGGALAAGLMQWSWLIGLAVAAVTVALVRWPGTSSDSATMSDTVSPVVAEFRSSVESDDHGLDYIRTRVPAVPVTQADGTVVSLRALALRKPVLLLAVSSMCGLCRPVIESRAQFRMRLPEVDVRILLTESAETSPLTERNEPQSLHDLNGFVRDSIDDWATPTAVLLGADGELAGGPVSGADAIADFVDQIDESLHRPRPTRHIIGTPNLEH